MYNFKKIHRYIKKLGSKISVYKNENLLCKTSAIVTPVRYKNKVYLEPAVLPIGKKDNAHYLYIGSPQIRLDQNPDSYYLICQGKRFTVKKADPFYIDNQIVYIWAILQVGVLEEQNV